MSNRDYRRASSPKDDQQTRLEPWDPRAEPRRSRWSPRTLTVVGGFLVLVVVAGVALGLLLNWYGEHSVEAVSYTHLTLPTN